MGKIIRLYGMGVLLGILGSPLPAACGAESDPVTLNFHEKNGHFDIQAGFGVEADRETVWETLTDFEHYPKLSPELKKVRQVSRSGNHWVYEQVAEGGFLFFTQKVFFLLDIHGEPGRYLICEDVSHHSFTSHHVRWDIRRVSKGRYSLSYRLKAEAHFDAPAFLVNDHFKGGAEHFLREMRKEILRRQASKAGPSPPVPKASVEGNK